MAKQYNMQNIVLEDFKEKIQDITSMMAYLNNDVLEQIYQYVEKSYSSKVIEPYLSGNNAPDINSVEFEFLKISAEFNGNISRKIMLERGLTDYYFRKFVEKYNLKEIMSGYFVYANKTVDAPFMIQTRYNGAVISHASALYYHGLTDVIPTKTIMSMPKSYNMTQLQRGWKNNFIAEKKSYHGMSGVEVKFDTTDPIFLVINEDINEEEIITMNTQLSNKIRVTSEERSIIDVLKEKQIIDEEIRFDAINEYISRYPNKITKLRRIAKKHRMLSVLDEYLHKYKIA